MPEISLIAAMDQGGLIGVEGQLPWHLPKDLAWFRKNTLNKPVLMGRNTYRSLNERPLPHRLNIVLSRTPNETDTQVVWARSVQAVLQALGEAPELMVIGGAEVYREFLPLANRLYLTRVHAQVAGDTYFPPIDWEAWQCIWSQSHASDSRHLYSYEMQIYERSTPLVLDCNEKRGSPIQPTQAMRSLTPADPTAGSE